MTDITELAQRMKAAAEKATPGCWEYYPGNTSIEYNVDSMDEDQGSIVYVDSGDFTQAQTDRNGEFIALANPANILALVEALEKAKQRITQLESRTVKLPKIRRVKLVSGEYVNGWTAHDVACALSTAGIKVEAE